MSSRCLHLLKKKFEFYEQAPKRIIMTIQARSSKKRKQHGQDEASDTFNEAVNLEMLSDEEDKEDVESDNGEVDEFPEIDAGSEESGEEDETYESEEDTGASGEGSSSGSQEQLHIFPEVKTIVSDITGQEKRVYPEIEPDYDSDSSTEDVGSADLFPNII